MKAKRLFYCISIVLLLAANIYFVVHRNEGYKYHPYKSYNELYVMDSSLYLKELNFTDDSLTLLFSIPLSGNQYRLKIDGVQAGSTIFRPKKNSITAPTKPGIHTYTLESLDDNSTAIIVKADHPTVKDTLLDYINEFLYCNLPGPGVQSMSLKNWQHGSEEFTEEEKQKGIKLLEKNTNVFKVSTDAEKALEIAKFVAGIPNVADGERPSKIFDGNGWVQIETAMKERVKLNCGNYSKIITYLCSILNIPNRIISYFGPNGNWSYGVHYLNEVYLTDKQQWAVLDGTLNIYLPHDSLRFYNVADLKNIARTGSLHGKSVFTYKSDSLINTSADSVKDSFLFYNQSNADLVFNYPAKQTRRGTLSLILNFYSFNQDVAFYSDTNRNNWEKIIVKTVTFYGLLLILSFLIISELWYSLIRRNIKNRF